MTRLITLEWRGYRYYHLGVSSRVKVNVLPLLIHHGVICRIYGSSCAFPATAGSLFRSSELSTWLQQPERARRQPPALLRSFAFKHDVGKNLCLSLRIFALPQWREVGWLGACPVFKPSPLGKHQADEGKTSPDPAFPRITLRNASGRMAGGEEGLRS